MKMVLSMLVVVLAFAATSQAGVVFYDNFEDGVLNTTLWTVTSEGTGIVSESGGQLTVQSNGGYWVNNGSIKSNVSATLGAGAGDSVVLSACDNPVPSEPSYGMQWAGWAADSYWGLTNGLTGSARNSISVYTDDTDKFLGINIVANGVSQSLNSIMPYAQLMLYGWKIEWSAAKVVVTSNVWGVRFDSSDPTKNGGINWAIPAAGTSMYAIAEADLHSNWMKFDEMKLETIPEPVSVCLFGLAGLLLRRKAA